MPDKNSHPDPEKWAIRRVYEANANLAIWIQYQGCTNYEGNKILVYESCTEEVLIGQGSIDPHFSDNQNYLSPIARFEPTERGWQWAIEWIDRI